MHTAGPAADHIAKHLMSGRCDALPDLRGAEAGMMKRRAEGVLFQPKSTPSFTEKHREFSTRVNRTRAGEMGVNARGFRCFRHSSFALPAMLRARKPRPLGGSPMTWGFWCFGCFGGLAFGSHTLLQGAAGSGWSLKARYYLPWS